MKWMKIVFVNFHLFLAQQRVDAQFRLVIKKNTFILFTYFSTVLFNDKKYTSENICRNA